jgi:PAS domain S-box-containing protein
MAALPKPGAGFDHEYSGSQSDALYMAIMESTAGITGQDFLYEIAAALARTLDVSTGFVSELLVDVDRALAVATCHQGNFLDPFEFRLSDGPCGEAVQRGRAIHRNGVAANFPRDQWLVNNQLQAYASVLLHSRSGDPLGLVGILHDYPLHETSVIVELLERLAPRVSVELERRQRDVALRRSEARFRLLIEHSKDIMFYYRVAPVEKFEYISPAVTEITGWPPEAFFANPQMAIEMLDPEYRAAVIRAMESGSEEPIVARIVRPDGKAGWVEYRNFPFRNDEQTIVAMGGSIRDVTDRIRAEEDLARSEHYRRALLDAAPDTIFRLDADGAILDYVPGEALREVMAAGGEANKQSIGDLVPLAYVAPAKRLIQEAIRTGRTQRFEFEVTAGADTRSYEARYVPFGEQEILLVVRDFTAMKWHAGEPERMRLRDELDVKVEGNLRLRNPYGLTYRELAVLHLVAEGSADKQIAEALGISIYTANKHVGNILGKMNAASRTEAGVRALREGLLG